MVKKFSDRFFFLLKWRSGGDKLKFQKDPKRNGGANTFSFH